MKEMSAGRYLALLSLCMDMDENSQIGSEQDISHLTSEGFARFARYITDELGIKMPTSKVSMIQSRLVRRVRELGLRSVEQYGEYLFSTGHDEERDHFINAVTTNKTDFFREAEQFSFLVEKALPSLDNPGVPGSRQVNVWSAACSSGEEPYTLAMVLSEYARLHSKWDFAILATDVSTRVLTLARQGIYSAEQSEEVPVELRAKYFLQSKEHGKRQLRIVPELRKKISFHRLNLISEEYRVKNRFDLIFLRNVLIYFDKKVQEAVVNRLCHYLKPGGYFFVGHSESLVDLNIPVTRLQPSIYRMLR